MDKNIKIKELEKKLQDILDGKLIALNINGKKRFYKVVENQKD